MANNSPIEWTDATWNPIVGCSIVSPGCTNCYAMKMASRIEAMGNQPRYAGTTRKVNGNAIWTGKLAQAPNSVLLAPLKRKKPTTYFVNSMGDLFHEDVSDEWIDRVFAVMALAPQHTFQVLTKRAARMRDYMAQGRQNVVAWKPVHDMMNLWHPAWIAEDIDGPHRKLAIAAGCTWPLPNVWLGVSAERQAEADERIPLLLETPAAKRFISAEPLLGPIDLHALPFPKSCECEDHSPRLNALEASVHCAGCCEGPEAIDIGKLDWVIVGGESGPNARPMHPGWARELRDQCAAAGVAFFFKQWGEFLPWSQFGGTKLEDHPEQTRFRTMEWEDGRWNDVGFPAWCDVADGNVDDEQCVGRLGKKAAGRHLDGVLHDAMPQRRSI